jgi:hypothetical protein
VRPVFYEFEAQLADGRREPFVPARVVRVPGRKPVFLLTEFARQSLRNHSFPPEPNADYRLLMSALVARYEHNNPGKDITSITVIEHKIHLERTDGATSKRVLWEMPL